MTTEKAPKTVLTCDIQAARLFSKKDLEREPELMTTCWWEYRGMHPVRRTEYFAAVYRKTYARYYGKYYDHSKHEMVSGLVGVEDPFDTRAKTEKIAKARRTNLTGLWRGRQAADELGISYPIYISAIFENACMKGRVDVKDGTPQFPRPVHLYSDRAKMVALDEQVKELERYTPTFKNATLMAGSQAPYKEDFDNFLYELGALKKIHTDIAFDRMVELGYITRDTAGQWLARARGG
jgi:hypothetical protein